jgi:hypothetical protein
MGGAGVWIIAAEHPDRFAAIARGVPGFGGFFFLGVSYPQTGYVYLTDPTIDLAPLKASMLRNLATYNPLDPDIQLVPLQGRYNWLQLKSWYNLAEGHVWALGATHSGMDPGNNRFLVDAADQTSFDAIKRELTALGVPEDAADVEIKAAPVPG